MSNLARYSSSAVERASSRAIDHERARAEVAVERLAAIAETVDAAMVAVYRNASTRAAVETARPEIAGYCELIMQRGVIAYGEVVGEVGRRR